MGLPDGFADKYRINAATGCWEWTAYRNPNGYGMVRIPAENQTRLAHRVAYAALVGPIPAGLQLDHLCRVRHCVNPQHLEPVTNRENMLRGETFQAKHAAQTHCLRGHRFTPENTYIEPSGSRRCVTCRRARRREARKRSA